jgi:hypothetical protein
MSKFIKYGGSAGRWAHPPIHHWDDLFNAVMYRLRHAVDPPAADHVRATVLDCAEALDTLQKALVSERTHRHLLEQEMRDTRETLAQARSELADATEPAAPQPAEPVAGRPAI